MMSVAQLPRKPAATSDSFCSVSSRNNASTTGHATPPQPPSKTPCPPPTHFNALGLQRRGVHKSPPPALLGKDANRDPPSTSAEVGPLPHPLPAPPTPHHHLAPRLTKLQPQGLGQQETEARRRQLSADTGEATPMLHAAQAPKNPRGSPPVAPR